MVAHDNLVVLFNHASEVWLNPRCNGLHGTNAAILIRASLLGTVVKHCSAMRIKPPTSSEASEFDGSACGIPLYLADISDIF